jgi:hypothetical protein
MRVRVKLRLYNQPHVLQEVDEQLLHEEEEPPPFSVPREAKVESSRVTSLLLQEGQKMFFFPPITSVSNSWSQDVHLNS